MTSDSMAPDSALELMAGLATPLWLLADDGTVLWSNRAARNLLGLADPPEPLAAHWTGAGAAGESTHTPGERPGATPTFQTPTVQTLTFQSATLRNNGSAAALEHPAVRCHLSRVDDPRTPGRGCLLAEVAADAPAQRSDESPDQCPDQSPDENSLDQKAVADKILEDILEDLPDGVALFDADQRLTASNRHYRALCRDGGLMPERVVGRLVSRPTPGPILDRQTTDGRWIRLRAQRRGDGGTLLVCSDVSELRHCQARLAELETTARQEDRSHATMLHQLSHELRTPLTAVIGFSEIIADDLIPSAGSQRYRDYAGEIRNAAGYMLDLINNILDLARVRAGQMESTDEPCDLGRLIALTVRLITARARATGVSVTVDLDPAPPTILADTMQVRQMLTNLVANAVKFAGPVKGRVDITTAWEEDGGLAVVISDTGIGMPADQIPQALHPFQQVHRAGTVADKGSGLGLALTKALIEQHDGRLSINSAPGAGTEVRLTFPPARIIADRPNRATPSMIRVASAVRRPS
jgi:signal transduction histidine kinase